MVDIRDVLRAPAVSSGTELDVAPSISVLIPAYNAAVTIGEAIESVLAQRPPPEQVVVSDDGSEDDLGGALLPFAGHIDVVTGPNEGLAAARNRAAAIARGDLLALVDADDIWLPGRAAALAEAARLRPDLDIITTDAFVSRAGRREPQTYYATRRWPEDDQRLAILRESFIFGAAAIRRGAFERVGGYQSSARFAEDWDLWIRMLFAGSQAGLVDLPLYEYRRHGESLTARRLDLALGVVTVLGAARRRPLAVEEQDVLRTTLATWRLRAARESQVAHDARRFRLSVDALRDPAVPSVDRMKLVARIILPRPLRRGGIR